LSCHIKVDNEYGISWILKPHLINDLKTKFRVEAMTMQDHGNLGTPWFKIVLPNNKDKTPIARQSRYRLSV
jgi:hypothetical protein